MNVPPSVSPSVPLSVPPSIQEWLHRYGEGKLKLRGKTWQVRVLKPKNLRNNPNDKYHALTTGTDSKAIAESLRLKVAIKIYQHYDKLYEKRNIGNADPDKFRDLARQILAQCNPPIDMDTFFKEQEQSMRDSGVQNVKTDQGEIANLIIHETGGVPEELLNYMDEDERKDLIYVGRRVEFDRQQGQLLHGKNDLHKGMDGFVQAGWDADKSKYKLSTLIPKYLEERSWGREKTKQEASLALKRFLKVIGDSQLPDLTPKDAYAFARWMEDELGSANASINNGVSYVSGLLTWAITMPELEFCTVNNFNVNGKLHLSGLGKAKEHYQPFTKPQLKEIFEVKANTREKLALCMLITSGCRLDEIALMEWDNIKFHEDGDGFESRGFMYMDTTFGLVKNAGSERYIPIPIAMESLLPPRGFTFNDDKSETRIFNYALDADLKSSRASSQAIGRVLKKIPTEGRGRQTTHSLRGNLKDMLRDVGCPKEINDFITGQGQGDVASKYGVGPSIVVRHQWLSKINFDFLPAKINYDKS